MFNRKKKHPVFGFKENIKICLLCPSEEKKNQKAMKKN